MRRQMWRGVEFERSVVRRRNVVDGNCSLDEMREKKASKSSSSTSPCALLRDAYHNCFNRWYAEKFMKGHWDKQECVSEWQKYRACLSEHLEDKHLIRFLEAEGIVQNSGVAS